MDKIIKKTMKLGDQEIVAKFSTRLESGYDVTVTDEIVIREIFDEDVYETPFDYMDGKVVLDIGANIGAYSIYSALAGATVFAYEPDDQNYEMLIKNIKLNGLEDKITVYKLGIYSKAGQQVLYNGQGASFIKGNKTPTPEAQAVLDKGQVPTQKITTITLDEAVTNIATIIDICKMDVEGSEYEIIKGANKNTLGRLKFITMEFHANSDPDYGLMIAKLQHTHNVHAFGNPQLGGQVIARRY